MSAPSTETVIRISPGAPEIAVEHIDGGVTARKLVTPESLARCFLQSRFDSDTYPTGLLPEGCIAATLGSGEIWYFIRHSELYADISYYGTEYLNFPLPRLVFGFRYLREERKVTCSRLCVIPDGRLRLDMPAFHYPFSNVSSTDGGICLGNNALPIYEDPSRLSTLPGHILRMPNNNDHFSRAHNKPGLEYRDLLELLRDKPPAYYYTDILVPNGKTLRDFINGG